MTRQSLLLKHENVRTNGNRFFVTQSPGLYCVMGDRLRDSRSERKCHTFFFFCQAHTSDTHTL